MIRFRVGAVVLGFWLGLTHGAFERLAFLTAARFVVSRFPSRFLVRSHLTLFERFIAAWIVANRFLRVTPTPRAVRRRAGPCT